MRFFAAALLAANFFFPSAIAEPMFAPGMPIGVMPAGALPEKKSEKKEVLLISDVVLASAGEAIALVETKNTTAPASTGP